MASGREIMNYWHPSPSFGWSIEELRQARQVWCSVLYTSPLLITILWHWYWLQSAFLCLFKSQVVSQEYKPAISVMASSGNRTIGRDDTSILIQFSIYCDVNGFIRYRDEVSLCTRVCEGESVNRTRGDAHNIRKPVVSISISKITLFRSFSFFFFFFFKYLRVYIWYQYF